MGVGGGEEEEEEVPKARMITSIRARIRCRGRLGGCPREGENRRKPRSTRSPSSKALLGSASEWVSGRLKCQALSQASCARVGLIAVAGRKRVRLLEMRFELVKSEFSYSPFQVSSWRNAISTSHERTTCGWIILYDRV
jgi:hypothetical protein